MLEIILLMVVVVLAVLVSQGFTSTSVEVEGETDDGAGAEYPAFNSSDHGALNAAAPWGHEGDLPVMGQLEMTSGTEWDVDIAKHAVNPATGFPMLSGDESGVDVMGNPYGADLKQDLFGDSSGSPCSGMGAWDGDCSGTSSGSFGGGDDWT